MPDDKLLVAGRNFDLQNLVQGDVLMSQLLNVFQILQRQTQEIQENKGQVLMLKSKMEEINTIKQDVVGILAFNRDTAEHIRKLDENIHGIYKEISNLGARATSLELIPAQMKGLDNRTHSCEVNINLFQTDAEQLRADVKEALTFSSNLSFFKNELSELHEEVNRVLQQAPKTENLMLQVKQMVDSSTIQIKSVTDKTGYMEATLGRMMGQSKEFEDLKISVALRLDAVERPRIDRVGGVEASLRDIHRQVKQLQHNWMTNWGAHEQSMALLRDDVMGHVEQMRRANGDGAAGSSHSAAAGAVTYIRLDEEDRKAIRKTLDQHGRDLARLDTKKADAGLVGCLLAEKAGVDALERKLDRSDFEEQLRALLRRPRGGGAAGGASSRARGWKRGGCRPRHPRGWTTARRGVRRSRSRPSRNTAAPPAPPQPTLPLAAHTTHARAGRGLRGEGGFSDRFRREIFASVDFARSLTRSLPPALALRRPRPSSPPGGGSPR
jgi:hypothetical protein